MSVDRGTVCWSDDPFKDDADAGRPWLAVSTGQHPFADEQSMVVALSTSGHDEALPIADDEWLEGRFHTGATRSPGQPTRSATSESTTG